jgi:hypothetical protein
VFRAEALRAATSNPKINYVVAMAPVTDLQRLIEFSQFKVNEKIYGLSRYYETLSHKHIFLQIANSDNRVGTEKALDFLKGLGNARGEKPVGLTAIITPNEGHGTARHDFAGHGLCLRQEWIRNG